MSYRKSSHAFLLATLLATGGCGGSDGETPGSGADAGADVGWDVTRADQAAREEESAEVGGDAYGAPWEGSDAAPPDAGDDRSTVADRNVPVDSSDASVVDGADARDAADGAAAVDASDAAMDTSDATDGSAADADDAAEAGALPSEVAYVATYLGGIYAFAIDTTTGALDPVMASPVDPGGGFYAIAVTKSGRFAYAADYLHGKVNGYRIARSGALQPLPSSPVDMGAGPIGLAVDPAERFVFVAASEAPNRIFVYRIDATTGALTAVEHSPFTTTDQPAVLAVDPQSRFLFASSGTAAGIRVFSIGDTSGALVEVSGSPFGKTTAFGGGIAFSQVGHFLYNGGTGVNAFLYDDSSGAMTEIEGSPFGQAQSDPTAIDIATDSMGGYVFAVHTAMHTLSAFTMDQGTGKLARIPQSPFDAAPSPYSIGVDPSVRFLLVGNDDADEVSVFSIEATPGDGLRQVAHSPFTVHGLQPEFAFVQFTP
jgi:6-phosphogluconolactonase (cycloisomerase 2 family)